MEFTKQAILLTVLYSDLFDFPLTKEELWKYLITDRPVARLKFDNTLQHLHRHLVHQDNYFCFRGKEKIITKRKRNLPEVQTKLHLAKYVAYYLSYVPTIKLIGISGGLSIGNVTERDDIDLFIVTKKGRVFFYTSFCALPFRAHEAETFIQST